MNKNITWYITTRGRVDKQRTYGNLPKGLQKEIIFVCPKDEAKAHAKEGRTVMTRPRRIQNLSQCRAWLIKNCPTRYMFILDDDLEFFVRHSDDSFQLRKLSDDKERMVMWEKLVDGLIKEKYHHVGLSSRTASGQSAPKVIAHSTRAMCVHGYNVETLRKEKIKLNKIDMMSDFHITLSLLRAGYENKVIMNYCYDQVSNTPGGCSLYRTEETLRQAASALQGYHPDFVTLVTRKAKWAGMSTRTDVRIQWKQAFKSSLGASNDNSLLPKRP